MQTEVQARNKCRMTNNNGASAHIVGLVFAGIGAALLLGVLVVTILWLSSLKNYKETEGEVIGTNSQAVETDISYSVNGEEYMTNLNYYSSSTNVGDVIKVFYSLDNPYEVRTMFGLLLVGGILGFMGLVFTIVGVALLLSIRNTDYYLYKHGIYLEANLVRVFSRPEGGLVNARLLWVIECIYPDPLTGEQHVFQSMDMYEDPRPEIEKNCISQFIVYRKKNDWDCYVVDLDYLLIPGQAAVNRQNQ